MEIKYAKKNICIKCKEQEIEYLPEICYTCIDKMLSSSIVEIGLSTKFKNISIFIVLYLLLVIPIYVFFGRKQEIIAVIGFCYGMIFFDIFHFIKSIF